MFEQLTTSDFVLASFCIILSVVFFTSNWYRNYQYQKMVKNIIKNNVIQLVKIYNRLYVDIDEFDGNIESDQQRASEITLYFERKHIRIEMIRINIENQLAHVSKIGSYNEYISKILDDLDIIMEKYYNPKLPLKYQLSIWQDNRDIIQSTTKNTVNVATDKLKII